jgi:hypothetical protein
MAKIVGPNATEWLRRHPGAGKMNADGSVYAPEVLVIIDSDAEDSPTRVFSLHPFTECVVADKYTTFDDGLGLMPNVIERSDVLFAHEIDQDVSIYFPFMERWILGIVSLKRTAAHEVLGF